MLVVELLAVWLFKSALVPVGGQLVVGVVVDVVDVVESTRACAAVRELTEEG